MHTARVVLERTDFPVPLQGTTLFFLGDPGRRFALPLYIKFPTGVALHIVAKDSRPPGSLREGMQP